jgi:antitoxin component YwqK of YwqJK toxin-antitoxin module
MAGGSRGATRPAILLTVFALAVVAGAVFWLTRQRPEMRATKSPEVHRTNLVLTAGVWFLPGDTNAFTGLLLDTHDDGAKKSQTAISNGLPHGLSLGWHTNGQQQVEEHFVAGMSHGVRTKWHANGQMLSQVTIVNGQLDGVFRRWDERGMPVEEIALKAGQADGVSRSFFPSGCVKAEVLLRGGQVVDRKSWQDGVRPAGG